MENENNVNENNTNENRTSESSMYHYGRNESPFSREDVSGRTNPETSNPYNQGSVFGQGIYTGENFASTQPEPDKKKKKEKKEKRAKKQGTGKVKKVVGFVALAAAFGLIAGGVMVGVNAVGNRILANDEVTTEVATVATAASVGNVKEDTANVADVAANVMPSIVSINTTSVQTVRSWFQSYQREVMGAGSGIIIGQTKDSVLVATNNHVIADASELSVAFCDETVAEATVKGADSSSDLAVLEVKTSQMEADTLKAIKVAALGDSDELRVGESAIAIGNALGYGQSVTVGYISALNRDVDTEDGSTMKMLQTDAAINPGNSGGALLNAKGEVIGINTAKYMDSTVEGMGYAIPISTAIPIINDLMNLEVIEENEQGYLGIQGTDVTEEYTQGFNMPKGVYVVKIIEKSPADECGLKAGDIITGFAGRDISSMEGLQNILSNKKAGEELEMIVQRNNEKGEYEEVTIKVTLGAKKDMPESEKSNEEATTEATKEKAGEYMNPEEFFEEFNGYNFYND